MCVAAWMGVTNLIKKQKDHVKRIARFAIDAIKAASETLIDEDDPERGCVQIRVGECFGGPLERPLLLPRRLPSRCA